jgi:hypothetical protein
MIEISEIIEIVNKIILNVNPEKIFLSYSSGNTNLKSDKDLLLIQVSKLPNYKRVSEIKRLIWSTKPIHIIIFTHDKLGDGEELQSSTLNNTVKTSKLLYERT